MKFVANTIAIVDSKKQRLANELMGAGAAAAIISGLCIVAACIVKGKSEFCYEAITNEAMDSIGKIWVTLDESVTKNG